MVHKYNSIQPLRHGNCDELLSVTARPRARGHWWVLMLVVTVAQAMNTLAQVSGLLSIYRHFPQVSTLLPYFSWWYWWRSICIYDRMKSMLCARCVPPASLPKMYQYNPLISLLAPIVHWQGQGLPFYAHPPWTLPLQHQLLPSFNAFRHSPFGSNQSANSFLHASDADIFPRVCSLVVLSDYCSVVADICGIYIQILPHVACKIIWKSTWVQYQYEIPGSWVVRTDIMEPLEKYASYHFVKPLFYWSNYFPTYCTIETSGLGLLADGYTAGRDFPHCTCICAVSWRCLNMLQGVPPWKWGSLLLYSIVIAGFVSIANERQEWIGKLLTKTPTVKCWLGFLRPAGLNGVTISPNKTHVY